MLAFRSLKKTPRFRKNQRVWVVIQNDAYLVVYWLYKGEYTRTILSADAPLIGIIREVEITESLRESIFKTL